MDKLSKELVFIWKNDIKTKFKQGKLVYERQLQADLYHLLKCRLPDNYGIWVEPVIYMEGSILDKSKPDLIITKDQDIIGIIELKFKPWEHTQYKGDIKKLMAFQDAALKGTKIWLGIIPVSPNWNTQNEKVNSLYFNLKKDLVKSFVVYAHPESDALNLKYYNTIGNLLLLYGFIKDAKNIVFNHKKFPG